MAVLNNLKNFFKKYYPIGAIIIFVLISFLIMAGRIPFWDEAHQIDIARLSFLEIFKITRVIGHPALWYLIIKPFSNPDIYPWGIYILNWLFCIASIAILWKKAPFNYLIKTLITFSAPFLFYFAPVSRCYGIGILCLFILCALYSSCGKHPYIFALIVVLGANTSSMVMIGCFYLGLLFLYDLYKNKAREFKNIIIIFSICAILILLQFIGAKKPYLTNTGDFLNRLTYFVIVPMGATIYSFLLHLFSSIMFYIFPIYCFKKSKKAVFFAFAVFLTLSAVFIFEYSGSYWNHYFYYIYFIIIFWIFYKELYQNKFIKFLFCAILFMFCFRASVFDTVADIAYMSHSKEISGIIIEKYKNCKIFALDAWSDITPGADIFLMKKNIVLYDIHNRKRTSYESLRDIYKMSGEEINFDGFYKNLDDNSLIVTDGDFRKHKYSGDTSIIKYDNDYIIQTKNKLYYLKNIEKRDDIKFYIYKAQDISSYGRIKVWS